MAARKKPQMFVIVDGPGIQELQFSDYNPEGHIVQFVVEETAGATADGEIRTVLGERKTMYVQVTGTDRLERRLKDGLGQPIPAGSRLIRVRQGAAWPLEGWYEPRKRRGFLREAKGWVRGLPPRDFIRKLQKIPVI